MGGRSGAQIAQVPRSAQTRIVGGDHRVSPIEPVAEIAADVLEGRLSRRCTLIGRANGAVSPRDDWIATGRSRPSGKQNLPGACGGPTMNIGGGVVNPVRAPRRRQAHRRIERSHRNHRAGPADRPRVVRDVETRKARRAAEQHWLRPRCPQPPREARHDDDGGDHGPHSICPDPHSARLDQPAPAAGGAQVNADRYPRNGALPSGRSDRGPLQ